jgi:hypothetical protein
MIKLIKQTLNVIAIASSLGLAITAAPALATKTASWSTTLCTPV